MVRPKFKAFLSCSFKEQDESLREWFKELIRSFGIDPFVATPQEPRPAQETIMNNIKDSQCFIAILTKNKLLQDSHQWVTSDYIQQEIGMSIATKKPMAIFIEKGVCIPDLLKGVTGYISFDREQIAVDTPKMTCLLLNLITELEQRLGYRPPPKLPYDIGNREFLSFEEFRVGLLYLHDIMEKQGFKPDVIVGMDRGGPTLAGILGKLRGCKVTSILIKDECMLSSTQDSLDPGLKNKDYRILLVDDACRKARASFLPLRG